MKWDTHVKYLASSGHKISVSFHGALHILFLKNDAEHLQHMARAHTAVHPKYMAQVISTQWVLDKCILTKWARDKKKKECLLNTDVLYMHYIHTYII